MSTPLNAKEQRVLGKLQNVPGLVLAHQVGTGKTRTSIQVANALKMPSEVVVPAALKENYKKEIDKWAPESKNNFHIQSQQGLAVSPAKLNRSSGTSLVVDEAHRARDPNSLLMKALQKSRANKRLLLSASPVYNHPADIAPLINLAANEKVLPENKAQFSEKFIGQKKVSPGLLGSLFGINPGEIEVLKNTKELAKPLKQYVDYEPAVQDINAFPSSREETVKVPMTENQQNIYRTIMGKAPFWMRWKVRAGLPPNKGELTSLQAFLTGARQVANSDYDFIRNKNKVNAPKAEAAVNFLKARLKENPNYKGVVYSNYLGSGLAPYKQLLEKHKIPYGEFSGELPPKIRNQMVNDYNADKLKALLISSAGAEGLDLKGTRVLQILEPHFNREKEKQVIGRAIRYKSHAALPEDQRNVLIQRYIGQPRAGMFARLFGRDTVRGTDEYISDMADRKEQLNSQMMNLIAQTSR